jgi:hypothetical protein
MPADPNEEIDRLTAELATYRHAFETTEADRDRWAARARELQERLDSAATAAARGATPQQPASSDDASLPPIDLAVQHRLARRLQLGQTAGHYFFIDVVGTCNLRCPSCAVGNAPAQLAKGLMSVATFDKILSKIRAEYSDCGRLFVDLYNWGEPGLHPDLSKFVGLARHAGFGVGLSSNLNVFPDLREVIKAEPDYLRISFSGMREATYGATHRGGSVMALKANMYRVRELIDRYDSRTVVQAGFHIYRSNFPDDFLAARALCDELGFLFAPIIASVMPAEKLVAIAQGRPAALETDLLSKLVLPVEQILDVLGASGPPTSDCQFRQARTTINFDGSVSLCCATYDPDKIIAGDFLSTARESVEAAKYAHPFCGTCMGRHVNKLYTGMIGAELNEAALRVLGPVFAMFMAENRSIGDPDLVVMDNTFHSKADVYQRGIAALSFGEAGWNEAERYFAALTAGAPDFAEGYFQAGSLAKSRGHLAAARLYAEEAIRMAPENKAYSALAAALRAPQNAARGTAVR